MSTATNGNGQLATQPTQQPRQHLVVHDSSQFANLLDTAKFEHLWRLSNAFSRSELVPAQFVGKPENCFIAIQMAIRLGVDPFMFMQSCYIVHGRPGLEAKLAIALANSSGVFKGPIQFRMEGEGKQRQCTAFATVRETDERIEMTVSWAMVEAEGWNKKNGSKWLTMPEIMFRYRAAMILIRTHCPEVIMGMQSKEEIEDTLVQAERPARQLARSLESLTEQMESVGPVTVDPSGAHVPITEEARRAHIDALTAASPPQREPGDDDPSSLEDAELAAAIADLANIASINAVESHKVQTLEALGLAEEACPEFTAACERRKDEIRGSRGGKVTRQAQMAAFDTTVGVVQ